MKIKLIIILILHIFIFNVVVSCSEYGSADSHSNKTSQDNLATQSSYNGDLPEFPEGLKWFNTDQPVTMDMLKGHVVLLDFWTYCCINCIHVIPDLNYLEGKYEDEPFIVVGVHSGKFDNEKNDENIQAAIDRYGIHHPVVADNDYEIWDSYGVRAWPTFILIGADGEIVLKRSGEGKRDILDREIKNELKRAREGGFLIEEKIDIRIESTEQEHFFNFPGKLAIDETNKHLYVSDSNNNRIVQLELTSSNKAKVLGIIGSGEEGWKDGSFKETRFNKPQGVYYQDDKLFIADTSNHTIRVADLKDKTVKTIAGNGKQVHFTGTDGTSLNSPWDLIMLDDVLYIAMAGNHQLWKFDLDMDKPQIYAGSGVENIYDDRLKQAELAQPSGLTTDGEDLYFADSEVSAIRKANTSNYLIETLIGKGLFTFGHRDGDFDEALLQHPLGVYYETGLIYVADTYNHSIRVMDLEEKKISTLIGVSDEGDMVINGMETDYEPLSEPNDMVFLDDVLYIADTNNHQVLVYTLDESKIETLLINP